MSTLAPKTIAKEIMSVPAFQRSSDIPSLVEEGAALDRRMKRDALRMAEIKTALIETGPGEYYGGNGSRVLVIYPAPRIAPKPETIPDVEKAIGKSAFNILFDQVIVWKPVKSCKDMAARILAPPKLRKFLELSETDCPAQVRFG